MAVFPRTGILDTFDRADENPIAGNWTNNALAEAADNQLKIVSNTLMAATALTSCEAYWNASTYKGYIEAYFTVVTKPGNTQRIELGFLQNAGLTSYQGYQCLFIDNAGTDTFTIQRIDQTATATVLSSINLEYNVGDRLGISHTPAGKITMWLNSTPVATAVDSNYSGDFYLYVGIRDTAGAVDNFGGGTISNSFSRKMLRPRIFAPGVAR